MKQETFTIRAYGKSELAMLYFPRLAPKTALRKLNGWIKVNPRLSHLKNPALHDYTPKQVRLIVEEIGEP